MSEFRRDPILGQWSIIQSAESWPIEKYPKETRMFRQAVNCQFCPGKEFFTPPEIDVIRDAGTKANGPGWRVRVISNKFPALRIEGNLDQREIGMLEMMNGIGAHEVLIETADHTRHLADLTEAEIEAVIGKYQSRVRDLTGDKRFKYIVIFKNYGESAGATVEHAHSQIIALPMIPKYVQQELNGTQSYYDQHKRCVFCDILQQEYKDNARIIAQNDDFVAFCPFVPRYSFEFWIFPKKHSYDFALCSESERFSLAAILKETLVRLKLCLSDPSYNYYLHIAPVNYEGAKSFHWHIEIVPKLLNISGFEWGTGFYVVRTSPERAAQLLRETKI